MPGLSNHRRAMCLFGVLFAVFIFQGIAFAGTPSDIRVTNVRGTQFTVSWISDTEETGSVRYGKSIEDHASWATADDDRGTAFLDDVHHVTMIHLSSETTYYYEIISGGTTDDNMGSYYALNPGPAINRLGSCLPIGQVFLSDRVTPAEGAIVYVTILGDGAEDSATESSLVDENGYWSIELTNFRTRDYSAFYSYVCGTSDILVEAQAGGDGITQMITTAVNWEDENDQMPDLVLQAGVIRGRVTDLETDQGIPDVIVQAWTEQCNGQNIGIGLNTDIDGYYTIKGLSVGESCYVRTDHDSDLYIDIWYDGIPADTCEGAAPVTVSAEDINFELDIDTDGDGLPDDSDGCPYDPDKTEPGQCGCGMAETDTDGDGTADCIDECDNDSGKTVPGVCGCGVPDTDTDNDGTADCNDNCPEDSNKTEPGQCGCGNEDTDTDNDGTADCNDECPSDPNKTTPGQCGCGEADTDSDGDGAANCVDDDYDNDGMPDDWEDQNGLDSLVDDADDDADGDGFSNIQEYNRGTDPQDPESHPSSGMPWLMLLLEE